MYLEWFYTLPLFFEVDGLRVVHACWDNSNIDWLKENCAFKMSVELLIASHNKTTKAYQVIQETLKGKEFDIPEQYALAG